MANLNIWPLNIQNFINTNSIVIIKNNLNLLKIRDLIEKRGLEY